MAVSLAPRFLLYATKLSSFGEKEEQFRTLHVETDTGAKRAANIAGCVQSLDCFWVLPASGQYGGDEWVIHRHDPVSGMGTGRNGQSNSVPSTYLCNTKPT
jgi:hypothetical protein